MDNTSLEFDYNTVINFDTGFQGFKSEKNIVIMPTKKKRWKDLSDDEKSENKRVASDRVRNEHAIGGVKRLRIVKDKIRAWVSDINYLQGREGNRYQISDINYLLVQEKL